jgi:hypothetical protein
VGDMVIPHDSDYRPVTRNGVQVSECYDCGWVEGTAEARKQHPSEKEKN